MKKILTLSSLLFCMALSAANIGTVDKISGNYLVDNGYFKCTFLLGNMFPGEFTFNDGTTPGIILFRDTTQGSDGKDYALYEERWADTRIVQNDSENFVIERHGKFYRNATPLITPLKGVEVICRYSFKKNSPEISIKFSYKKAENVVCKLKNNISLSWYFVNPFTTITARNKVEKLQLQANKKVRFWDTPGQIILANESCRVTLKSKRVIASLRSNNLYPIYLNGGVWQKQWKKGTQLDVEAVLMLEKLK